jgi:hypothetical protein
MRQNELKTEDMLTYLFAIAKNNWPIYRIYPIFKELKEKFPKDKNLSEFLFYSIADSYHSRELEGYLSCLVTYGTLYNNASQFTHYFMTPQTRKEELEELKRLPIQKQKQLRKIAKQLDKLVESGEKI